jgi:hypothetical protein
MRILPFEYLLKVGQFANSSAWRSLEQQIVRAIGTVVWPPGAPDFTLFPRRDANGVTPIKSECMRHLQSSGWELEVRLPISSVANPGPLDAVYRIGDRFFCVEWETGNISSSHRAMNKMALGLVRGVLIGGALILPSGEMARYLTQRVGNLPEFAPYFPLYRALNVAEGLLVVIPIEHDGVSFDVPRIPKGTDGRARG